MVEARLYETAGDSYITKRIREPGALSTNAPGRSSITRNVADPTDTYGVVGRSRNSIATALHLLQIVRRTGTRPAIRPANHSRCRTSRTPPENGEGLPERCTREPSQMTAW